MDKNDFPEILERLTRRYVAKVGGRLTASSMSLLDGDRMTLLAYWVFRREMLEGGMVQLIHNGYGAFIFDNPFAKAMRLWGLKDFSKFLYGARELYVRYGEALTADCTEEEFMALYERYEVLDDFDDEFVECEPRWTSAIAAYVSGHEESFNMDGDGGQDD